MGRTDLNRERVTDKFVDGARRAHQDSQDAEEHAKLHRARRDVFIRRLYATKRYTYPQLEEQTGISRELIAKIVQGRTKGRK